MATNAVLQEYGTQLMFADFGGDFDNPTDPTAANYLVVGTPTEIQMNFSVIAAAAAWQSVKTASLAQVGTSWPEFWTLGACMESTAAVTGGGTFDFYWNASPSGTAGTANSGNASGTDLAFAITGLPQLFFIGSLTVIDAQLVNIDTNIGVLRMPHLYGSLIMVNNTDKAMVADADADQCHAVLTPVYPDIQASA